MVTVDLACLWHACMFSIQTLTTKEPIQPFVSSQPRWPPTWEFPKQPQSSDTSVHKVGQFLEHSNNYGQVFFAATPITDIGLIMEIEPTLSIILTGARVSRGLRCLSTYLKKNDKNNSCIADEKVAPCKITTRRLACNTHVCLVSTNYGAT